MMQVGDRGLELHQRVYVQSAKDFGIIVGLPIGKCRVLMDGQEGYDQSELFDAKDVFPVEVVVLEGKVQIAKDGTVFIGDDGMRGILRLMQGEEVRLVVERVKREG